MVTHIFHRAVYAFARLWIRQQYRHFTGVRIRGCGPHPVKSRESRPDCCGAGRPDHVRYMKFDTFHHISPSHCFTRTKQAPPRFGRFLLVSCLVFYSLLSKHRWILLHDPIRHGIGYHERLGVDFIDDQDIAQLTIIQPGGQFHPCSGPDVQAADSSFHLLA